MKWRNGRKITDPDEYQVFVPDPRQFRDNLEDEERWERQSIRKRSKTNHAK